MAPAVEPVSQKMEPAPPRTLLSPLAPPPTRRSAPAHTIVSAWPSHLFHDVAIPREARPPRSSSNNLDRCVLSSSVDNSLARAGSLADPLLPKLLVGPRAKSAQPAKSTFRRIGALSRAVDFYLQAAYPCACSGICSLSSSPLCASPPHSRSESRGRTKWDCPLLPLSWWTAPSSPPPNRRFSAGAVRE